MSAAISNNYRIGVVIPCYNVRSRILDVIHRLPSFVEKIYVVDDACPEHTGQHVAQSVSDSRAVVVTHATNQGVGGAMATGYLAALSDGMDIVAKIDGDGQMDPALLPKFIQPIVDQRADYAKGNRFYELESLRSMPTLRLLGNAALSFVNKLSCGYWDLMDPTNGYTAIHAKVLRRIPLQKLSRRYFFESDMLFRLATLRAVVVDVPMDAKYGDEKSGLKIAPVALTFPPKYLKRMVKRLFYNYFLRDFNAGTIQFLLGALLVSLGGYWGVSHWFESAVTGVAATSGTVMLAALPLLVGFHLLIAALNYDIANVPRRCLHPMLS